MAGYRYFESSYYNLRHDLVRLDRMVWELRRYCQPLDQTLKTGTGSIELLPMNLERLRQTSASKSKDTCIISGWLEGVIKKKKHPSREALLWNNLFFGPSRRKTVKLIAFSESGNSPLSMHPEVLEDAMRYVHIPHHLVKLWQQELIKRAKVNH